MNEQMHLDDRLDRFKGINSAQVQKEKTKTLREFFDIPKNIPQSQILSKEKQLRHEYQKQIKNKEEELGFVMWNIAEGMLQQAFYGGDQSSLGSSQKQMVKVLNAVSEEEKRNTGNLKKYIQQAKKKVVEKIFW